MPILKAGALVVRKTPFSNTSLVVSLFTREYGRLNALARGARRVTGKTRFQGGLDLLTRVDVVVYTGRPGGLGQLAEAYLVTDFRGIHQRLDRLDAAFSIAELIREFTSDGHADPEYFASCEDALFRLERSTRPRTAFLSFWIRSLEHSGLAPNMDGCVRCGNPRVGRSAGFSPVLGGIVCVGCGASLHTLLRLDGGARAVYRALLDPPISDVDRIDVPRVPGRQLCRYLAMHTAHQIGRLPVTLRRYLPPGAARVR